MNSIPQSGFKSFKEFYPFYLQEHSNRMCKIMHFVGTVLVLALAGYMTTTSQWASLWWSIPLAGYGFAWIGHFGFEKNRPATFKNPFYSLRGDFTMFYHLLTGRLSFATGAPLKTA